MLAQLRQGTAQPRQTVVVQLEDDSARGFSLLGLDSFLFGIGGRVLRTLRATGVSVVSLPADSIEALAERSGVRYISPDRPTRVFGHVTTTTGTDSIRTQTNLSLLGLVSTRTTFDGASVGLAVLDSGLDAGHSSFRASFGTSRVVYSRDFTGEGRTDDPYGHGTHVASLAAGSGQASAGAYTGIAPGAHIVNLRVLSSDGAGTTSGLLAALDWVMANRAAYNLRVVNMSLGAPAIDSHRNDPVCRAVQRLVDAGVVVVAAAGNNGKDADGNKVYGRIHSPGNEPSALTVGASNTFGTDARSDDQVTTYSSRGPTRAFHTDEAGVRHYDNVIKPDLVAPGNRLVGAAARSNRLLASHPEFSAGADGGDRRMMYLSGTSMSAPVVAGAAALLLQANPRLTPNLVKAILMYTAQPLAGANTFEQGAGALNVDGAVRVAQLVRRDLTARTALGAPLLTAAPPAPLTNVAGSSFAWAQGLVLRRACATGPELIGKYQKVYAAGRALGDGVVEAADRQSLDPAAMTAGVSLGTDILTSDGTPLGGGSLFLNASQLLGYGIIMGDGIVMGDGILKGDGIMMGDGIVMGDANPGAAGFGGDASPSMR